VTVYGDDYETADGTSACPRARLPPVRGSSCALNLANAQGYSVMEVTQVAQRLCGKPIRVEKAPRRPGDPQVLVG
jgi:UDP-glucose 4-epimerase